MLKRLTDSDSSIAAVDVREAHRRATDEDALILDVREDDEVREVAVPGAMHIPLGRLAQQAGDIPKDRDVLVLCRSGNRSSMATEMLRTNGYGRAHNITGGIIAWRQARLPVE